MRILFLDDDPIRHEKFRRMSIGHSVEHVHSVFGARLALEAAKEPFDVACLDHDLGCHQLVEPGDDTGYAVAQAIAEMPADRRPKRVIVHSFNPIGAQAMARRLHEAGVRVAKARFGTFSFPPNEQATR